MRTGILIFMIVLIIFGGLFIGKAINWVRHSQPRYENETIRSEDLDVETVRKKKWLKFDPDLIYFYERKLQYKYTRGTFPFLKVDTIEVTPNELYTRKPWKQ